MNEIDDLFRRYGADVPEPDPAQAKRVAETVVAQGGRRRRPGGRHIAMGMGALGAAALATVLVILFVQVGEERKSKPAQPAGWGLDMTIRVTPTDGSPLGEVTDRAVAVLKARADARRMRGVVVSKITDGEVRLVMPTVDRPDPLADMFITADLTVVDLGTALAVDADPTQLVDEITAATRPGEPIAGYVSMRKARSHWLVSQALPTEAEARRFAKALQTPGPTTVVALPKALTISAVSTSREGFLTRPVEYVLTRADDRVLSAADIVGTHTDGDRLVLDLTDRGRERFDAALREARQRINRLIDRPVFALVESNAYYAHGSIFLAELSRVETASFKELDTPPDVSSVAAGLALSFAGGALPATVNVVSSVPYGVRPSLGGESPDQLPSVVRDALAGFQTPPDAKDVRRAATPRLGSKSWSFYAVRASNGNQGLVDFAWLVPDRPTAGEVAPLACGSKPGDLLIDVCFEPSQVLEGSRENVDTFGRVAPDAKRVEGRLADGSVVPAATENGWFVLTSGADLREIVAYDAADQEIARVSLPSAYPVVQPGG